MVACQRRRGTQSNALLRCHSGQLLKLLDIDGAQQPTGEPTLHISKDAIASLYLRRNCYIRVAPIITGQVLSTSFDWNDDTSGILGWVSYLSAVLSVDQPRPVVKLLTRTDAEIAVALGIDVSKRITLALTSGLYPPALNGDYFVEGFSMRHAADQDIECTLTLWGKQQGLAGGFRISGALGGGQDYSTISAAMPAQTDDRIWF